MTNPKYTKNFIEQTAINAHQLVHAHYNGGAQRTSVVSEHDKNAIRGDVHRVLNILDTVPGGVERAAVTMYNSWRGRQGNAFRDRIHEAWGFLDAETKEGFRIFAKYVADCKAIVDNVNCDIGQKHRNWPGEGPFTGERTMQVFISKGGLSIPFEQASLEDLELCATAPGIIGALAKGEIRKRMQAELGSLVTKYGPTQPTVDSGDLRSSPIAFDKAMRTVMELLPNRWCALKDATKPLMTAAGFRSYVAEVWVTNKGGHLVERVIQLYMLCLARKFDANACIVLDNGTTQMPADRMYPKQRELLIDLNEAYNGSTLPELLKKHWAKKIDVDARAKYSTKLLQKIELVRRYLPEDLAEYARTWGMTTDEFVGRVKEGVLGTSARTHTAVTVERLHQIALKLQAHEEDVRHKERKEKEALADKLDAALLEQRQINAEREREDEMAIAIAKVGFEVSQKWFELVTPKHHHSRCKWDQASPESRECCIQEARLVMQRKTVEHSVFKPSSDMLRKMGVGFSPEPCSCIFGWISHPLAALDWNQLPELYKWLCLTTHAAMAGKFEALKTEKVDTTPKTS